MVKNLVKALVVIAIIWLPTGTTDFIIIPAIINAIGFQMYMVISGLLVYLLYKNIEGKDLGEKLRNVHKGIKSIFS